jgi:iron(III) transport system substrate-binding protein
LGFKGAVLEVGVVVPYRREVLIAVGVLAVLALAVAYYAVLPRAPEAVPAPAPAPAREELLKQIIEEARREGRLVIYSTLPGSIAWPLIKRFEELYPFIKVRYSMMSHEELLNRFRSEVAAGAPTADIIWFLLTDVTFTLISEGHALPYKLTFYDRIPPEAKFRDLAYATSYVLVAPIFNKDRIPRDLWPRSYGDILNLLATRKELFPKGSVCFLDPAELRFYLMVLYYQYRTMEPYFTKIYRLAGEVGVQQFRIFPEIKERVRAGECAIALIAPANYLIHKPDPDIGVFIPKDYAHLFPRMIFITKHARNPYAAKLFLEFVLSDEGQKLLSRGGEVILVENPEHPELSLIHIKRVAKNVVVARPDDRIINEILKEETRKSFQEYFRKLVGLG